MGKGIQIRIYDLKASSQAPSFRLQTVSIELVAMNFNYRKQLPASLGYEYIKMIHPAQKITRGVS